MEKILSGISWFLEEYGWEMLLAVPVIVLLIRLLALFVKLMIRDPKGTLGAVFTVLGVLAVLVVPGVIFDPDIWGRIVYLVILGAFFVFFLIKDPKGVLKAFLTVIAYLGAIVAVGFIFGAGAAAAVGVNGVCFIFPAVWAREIVRYCRLKRSGERAPGRFICWTGKSNTLPVIAYTTVDGEEIKQAFDIALISHSRIFREKYEGETTVIYDKDAPEKAFIEKHSLSGYIASFAASMIISAISLTATWLIARA